MYALLTLALLLVLAGEGLALYYEWERVIELLFYMPAGIFMMLIDYLSRYKPDKGWFRTTNIFGLGMLLIITDQALMTVYGQRYMGWGICALHVFYFVSIVGQLQKRFSEPNVAEEE